MPERLIVVVLVLAGVAAFGWWIGHRQRTHARAASGVKTGRVSIVYFSAPGCRQCHAQKLLLDRLISAEPDIELIDMDAQARRDSARRWNVLTVPTCFVLDRNGAVTAVNNGFASEHRLRQQIAAAQRQLSASGCGP